MLPKGAGKISCHYYRTVARLPPTQVNSPRDPNGLQRNLTQKKKHKPAILNAGKIKMGKKMEMEKKKEKKKK